MLRLAAGLLFIGLFIKAGLVPFHWWLPDAYSVAPAPVSILLAGIVTKATGVYALIRLSIVLGPVPGLREAMLAIGLLTILFGAFAAIGQKEFKRMLAYSSASQVGYIVLALGCGTPLALVGAVFHFLNHSVFKTLLFVDSAAMESSVGNTDLNGVTGLTNKMPVTGTTSVLALLATAGIPPLSGFWSKLVIFLALWQAGLKIWAAVAVVASVVTLAYFLSMQRRVFFGKPSEGLDVREADWKLVLPEIVLAVLVVGIGVGFPFVLAKILPIQNLLK
jgi:formate hydrogenlyase subunit 3/multisubunit Na+/H+ antiporter MnhD subunit